MKCASERHERSRYGPADSGAGPKAALGKGLRYGRLQKRIGRGEYVSPADNAWAYARLRDPGNTLLWLKRAFDEHASLLLELRDPGFDFVRDTPQFQVLARQVAMPGLSAASH